MPASDSARTWDGLDIADDDPIGATIVVRRPAAGRRSELLLLHRAVNGADYDGDWAWTSPAGCRFPGEPVYPAALRELAEETGLTGHLPWAVDLSSPSADPDRRWAVFALDIAADTVVDLMDPEHDRYEWLSPEDARARIRPSWVAARQVDAVVGIPVGAIGFRPMERSDFPAVAAWQRQEHVAHWFHGEAVDEAAVERRYGPRLDGLVPTRMWVVELDRRPIGMFQDYRVGDHPDYAAKVGEPDAVGIDYLIGEPDCVGRGFGTRAIWEFMRDVLVPDYSDSPRFLASPSHRNAASLRALEKCGFSQGLWIDELVGPENRPDTEIVCVLDRAHWFGTGAIP